MKKPFAFIFITILIISSLSACGGRKDETLDTAIDEGELTQSEFTNTAPEPVYGGELRMAMRRPATLNPILNADITVDRVLSLIFEPLFNLNDNFTLQPSVAANYELAPDGLSAVITLSDGYYWSDGAKVTAVDFVFSVELLINAPSSAIYKPLAENFLSVAQLTDNSARVEFKEVKSGMEYCFIFPIIPEHYYKYEQSAGTARNLSPVGNGAFFFVSYDNNEILLNAFQGTQRAYFDSIRIIISPDTQTDIHAFNQGVTDVLAVNYSEYNKNAGPRVKNLYGVPSGQFDFIGFNFNSPLFANIIMREAVARSVNIDAYINNAYLGLARRAHCAVHPDSWLVAPEFTEFEYEPSFAASLARSVTDGEPAVPVRLIVNEENAERVYIAQDLAKALTYMGLDTRLIIIPFEDYEQRLINGDFDIFIGGYNLSFFPKLSFAFHSLGEQNYFSYQNAELDMLLKTADTTTDDYELYAALADAQRHINDRLVVIGIAFRDTALLTGTDIHGEFGSAPDNIFKNVGKWYKE